MEAGLIAGAGIFMVIYIGFIVAYLGVGIYCLVLFIKLATRGIKALDLYNNKQTLGSTSPKVNREEEI